MLKRYDTRPSYAVIDKNSPLARGLVFAWIPTIETGAKAIDISGKGNHGTICGATWVNDKYGKALRFPGSASYASIGKPILAGLSSFSIVTAIKTSQMNSAGGKAIYSERPATGNDILKIDSCGNNTQSNKVFFTYRNDSGNLIQSDGIATINDGVKHPIAVTKKSSDIFVYVDGKQDHWANWPYNDNMTNSGMDSRIAGDIVATYTLDGIVYYVLLYNRALSPNEIYALSRPDPLLGGLIRNPARHYLYNQPVGGSYNIPAHMHYYESLRRASC